MNLFPKNKGGWIRIVEAFVAVLLIAGVVLVVLDKGYIEREDPSEQIYEKENAILREIQTNNTLRDEILLAPLPRNWTNFPPQTKAKIQFDTPSYLICEANICEINDACLLETILEKNVYVRSISVTATPTTYASRQLKLFCWLKG